MALFVCVFSVALAASQVNAPAVDNEQSMRSALLTQVRLGVDYYPEQWPEDEMLADMRSIRNDLGADIVRVGEFMWQEIEPQDGSFNFTKLDTILDAAASLGLRVMLGTPTATMPAWLYTAHPDVVTIGPDSPDGFKAAAPAFGGRRQYSFNSATYLAYAKRLVSKLVERYGQHPAVAVWQVDNELGHEQSDLDFSPNALAAWRTWLSAKYNDINTLNRVWGTVFWGATYSTFEQVGSPTCPVGMRAWRATGSISYVELVVCRCASRCCMQCCAHMACDPAYPLQVGLPTFTMPGTPARPNENFRSNQSPGNSRPVQHS